MKVIFRVDSSNKIGSGHIMRCIAMAEKLKCFTDVIFISRRLKGNINHIVSQSGFNLIELEAPKTDNGTWLTVGFKQDAEETVQILKSITEKIVLITDHYELDEQWETIIKPYVNKIVVIDDLGNRKHYCNILIDNSTEEGIIKYKNLINYNGQIIYGRQYQIFRDEFLLQKAKNSCNLKRIEKVLAFFGGSDPTAETLRFIRNLNFPKYQHIKFYIIIGESNPLKDYIARELCCFSNTELLIQISNMAECLTNVDICFGAAGVSNWERVFLQVPSFCVSVADNQKIAENTFDFSKPYIYLGHFDNINDTIYEKALEWAINNVEILNNIKHNASKIFENYEKNINFVIREILKE